MKIGKITKTEKISNPFRPKVGLPRKYSVCRVTDYEHILQGHTFHLTVDHDPNGAFDLWINAIPSTDKFFDVSHEVWRVNHKYLEDLMSVATSNFDVVFLVTVGDEVSETLKKDNR